MLEIEKKTKLKLNKYYKGFILNMLNVCIAVTVFLVTSKIFTM